MHVHHLALHHVLDALTRIPEEQEDQLCTTLNPQEMHKTTANRWYIRRRVEVESNAAKFPQWQRLERLNILRLAIVHALDKGHRRRTQIYNRNRQPVAFHKDDLVFTRTRILSSKARSISISLFTTFTGPFIVESVISSTVVELVGFGGKTKGRVSISDIKKYRPKRESNYFLCFT